MEIVFSRQHFIDLIEILFEIYLILQVYRKYISMKEYFSHSVIRLVKYL